jgi:hypothetical protein
MEKLNEFASDKAEKTHQIFQQECYHQKSVPFGLHIFLTIHLSLNMFLILLGQVPLQ